MSTLTIFIHGIGSDKQIWQNFIKTMKVDMATEHIEEYTLNQSKVKTGEYYYHLYEYNSKKLSLFKPIKFIKEQYSGMVDSGDITMKKHSSTFASNIKNYAKDFENMNIVAHSMGGIITMQMLFDFMNTNDPLTAKINHCLLYATPLKGSHAPSELQKCLSHKITSNILNELKPQSNTISSLSQKINHDGNKLKDYFNIKYVSADADKRIIDVDKKFSEKFGTFESVSGGHSDILSNANLSSHAFNIYKEIISNTQEISCNCIILNMHDDENEIEQINTILNKFNNFLTKSELNDLNRLLQELSSNCHEHGGADYIRLEKLENKIVLTDNGFKFNPLEDFPSNDRAGSFTMNYCLENKTFTFSYDYIDNKNKLTININTDVDWKSKDDCYIVMESKRIKKKISLIQERIQNAIEKNCQEVVLDLSQENNIQKMSKNRIELPIILKQLQDNNKNTKLTIRINKENHMQVSAYETIFADMLEKYNVQVEKV